jgi:hypothetical protein
VIRKRVVALVVSPLLLAAIPGLWVACTSPQASSGTPAPAPQVAGAQTKARPVAFEADFHQKVRPFIETYCVECHGGDTPEAELDLSKVKTFAAVANDPVRWEQVRERIAAGEMPPDDAKKHPSAEQQKPVLAWLEAVHQDEIQRHAGDPGIVLARRLSNAEYDYTIRDLTGVDIRPTKEFPVDPANEAGFDNSGESLAMSPSLVTKYLDAARTVADHIVFTPDGLRFAPYAMTTDEDRDKYAVHRVVDFYLKQSLDYADFFAAAWRFQHRTELGRPKATLAEFARQAGVSPKYLATLWALLQEPNAYGPIAAVQSRWKALPAPAGGSEPAALRDGCVALRDFVKKVRPLVKSEFDNLGTNRRIAPGSQTLVLWKDHQYAAHRTTYAGNAQKVDWAEFNEPALVPPGSEADRARYEESFKRFCAVIPDSFYISERARMFLTNPKDIASDLAGHRLLTAGFHSQMGYFRDDIPLYQMVLDPEQQREIDRLWVELDFITRAPLRQFRQFIWFERAEPPSYMNTPEFRSFRSEDDDITTEPKLKELARVYIAKAENLKVDAAPMQAVRDYFSSINASIRALEAAQLAAEPKHLASLLTLAGKASRRPLSAGERDEISAFYRKARAEGLSHEDAIRDTFVSVLMSPSFTYRVDLPRPNGADRRGIQPLTDYELANRLSYFLWASMPDEELMALAAAGRLHQPDVLVSQARRMLQDRRVRGLATEFGGNWLDIRRFEEHNAVDRERFPMFTNELRAAMFEEPIRFMIDVIHRDGSVLDFVYGKHTFVNGVLAKHYGMTVPEVAPELWTRVDQADRYQRGGLLPMAVFLTKHAPGLRTSPVKRGHWVVTKLLGEHIPAPPPNVPVLPTDERKLGDLTLRQTLAKHREDKNCASCHNKFDSLGLVFEGFGPVGEVRTTDLAGRPAETTATFPDGSEGSGLPGLQTYFRSRVEHEFLDNLSRKLMVFALGRTLRPADDLVISDLRQKLAKTGNRFSTLVEGIVTSQQFLTKRVAPEPALTQSP